MLELDCMLPNLVNTCLHRSTHANFCPFTEGHKNWLEKIKEDMVDWPSIVFTCEGVVDITSVRKRRNYAIQVLVLMVVNCIRTQCVNQCHHDLKRVVISLQKPGDLYNSIRLVASKILSCRSFNAGNLIVKMIVSVQKADGNKKTAS